LTIMFVESGQSGGGSFGSQYLLIREINKEAFQPIVVYLNETRWVKKVRELGIPVIVLADSRYSHSVNRNVRKNLNRLERFFDKYFDPLYLEFIRVAHYRTIKRLRSIIREFNVDIVHLNNQCNRDIFGIVASTEENTSCICHIRSHRADGFRARRARYINANVDWVISASKNALSHWTERGISQERASVIYNGVRTEQINQRCTDELSARFGIAKGSFLFGSVGALIKLKGHQLLLDAWQIFSKTHPEAFLIIIGEGSERQVLTERIAHDRIGRVQLVGYQEDATKIISGLNCLVSTSENENCSRVILEAMATRTPIIASKVGGNPELVVHEETGLLFNYGDAQDLANVMAKMVRDSVLRERFASKGYDRVKSQFSVEGYISRVEEVYRQVGTSRT
ncbi:MAG: glycosyltransferase family 4 protein, partial [Gammaproteobacteria bacterium]